MQVETILQSKGRSVVTVTAGSTIAEAVDLLNGKKIGAVVVVDGKRVVGILSERDVVRHLGRDWGALASRPVSDVMTKAVVTVSRFATVADVMERMTEKRIRHMPIVDNGELVGIVSIGDVVKRKIEETEQEATALKEYIAS
ncbi:MAG: CBS domain-containing protein [Devosia sp.]|uniref:CBS domain-containing protein n=1 Tax=Devosia sp. TaxID=1871048 RepID=UPI001A5E59E1|nr:CBS domain-containing protein [Devosia sp.]MBL8596113.1 CBS domain-containing protein [Devosia sp.]